MSFINEHLFVDARDNLEQDKIVECIAAFDDLLLNIQAAVFHDHDPVDNPRMKVVESLLGAACSAAKEAIVAYEASGLDAKFTDAPEGGGFVLSLVKR